MKDIKQTIKQIRKELEESPEDAHLWNELGVGHHLLGDYREAVDCFRKAIRLDEDTARFYFNLANSFYELEQIEFAINAYLDALDRKPDYVPALNNLADIYELAGKPEKAQDLFEYITRIEPENPLAWVNLGNHFLRQNDTVEAGKAYSTAIDRDPECHEAYNNIGFILKHLGKYEQAAEYFQKCLEIEPDYEPAMKDLEECRQKLAES